MLNRNQKYYNASKKFFFKLDSNITYHKSIKNKPYFSITLQNCTLILSYILNEN